MASARPVAAPPSTVPGMTIGASLFLIAAGAILRYAVTANVKSVDLQTVGVILMVVGVVGLLLGIVMTVMGRQAGGGGGGGQPPPVR